MLFEFELVFVKLEERHILDFLVVTPVPELLVVEHSRTLFALLGGGLLAAVRGRNLSELVLQHELVKYN